MDPVYSLTQLQDLIVKFEQSDPSGKTAETSSNQRDVLLSQYLGRGGDLFELAARVSQDPDYALKVARTYAASLNQLGQTQIRFKEQIRAKIVQESRSIYLTNITVFKEDDGNAIRQFMKSLDKIKGEMHRNVAEWTEIYCKLGDRSDLAQRCFDESNERENYLQMERIFGELRKDRIQQHQLKGVIKESYEELFKHVVLKRSARHDGMKLYNSGNLSEVQKRQYREFKQKFEHERALCWSMIPQIIELECQYLVKYHGSKEKLVDHMYTHGTGDDANKKRYIALLTERVQKFNASGNNPLY